MVARGGFIAMARMFRLLLGSFELFVNLNMMPVLSSTGIELSLRAGVK
jgi:hypothetical protein